MAENLNINETVAAWANIVIEKWEEKVSNLGISDTHALTESFKHDVITQSNGDVFKVIFTFNYYGKFVDMGVGKGTTIDQVGLTRRRLRQWYSRTFFAQVLKLGEILAEKYGKKATSVIVETIEGRETMI